MTNKLLPNLGVPLSHFTIPKHRVGGFCTPLRSGFLSAEKADKRTGFSKKEKTIRQPPNASKMAIKNYNCHPPNSYKISIPLLRGPGGGILKTSKTK
jgi:hypothetical protein